MDKVVKTIIYTIKLLLLSCIFFTIQKTAQQIIQRKKQVNRIDRMLQLGWWLWGVGLVVRWSSKVVGKDGNVEKIKKVIIIIP